MPVMAEWNGKVFEISDRKIYALQDLEFSYKYAVDTNKADNGNTSINKKGKDPVYLSFAVKLSDAVGVDVQAELSSWEFLLGTSATIILGSSRFGTNKFMLTEVTPSEIDIDNFGRFRSCILKLKFIEDVGESLVETSKTNTTKLSATSKKATTAPAVASSAARKELGIGTASSMGASSKDKSSKGLKVNAYGEIVDDWGNVV